MNNNDIQKEQYDFKAEMKQLLNIIVHSLYKNPEIFLRELVSNSSDALNKVRFKSLTEQNVLDPELELKISITVDKDKELFCIEDTGCGMTKDELINQLGTVASSGTLEFLKQLQEQGKQLDSQLIGKFGVGFYSVFMVTDEVIVETRSYLPEEKAYRWKSLGLEKFSIEEIEKPNRGTKIYFKLKDEYKNFYEVDTIKSILKRYSNFVDYPIYLNNERVNVVSAIWHRKKEDIKEEELIEFYKFITNDYEAPLAHLHFSIEGNINFKALLFIPSQAPLFFFREITDKTVHLYSSKIFIQDDCKELLPDYLKFVKGVVDTEDLPLNVSREQIQASPLLAKMRSILTSKILAFLEELMNTNKEKYDKFYKNFHQIFKMGLTSDFANKEKIIELLKYETNLSEDEQLITLKEYTERMKPNQKEIYYCFGESKEKIKENPKMEYFNKNSIEVILLTDPVDIFTFPYINEYNKYPLVSIEKANIKIDENTEPSLDTLSPPLAKELLNLFKEVLGDKVEDVIESKRLVDSPVTLVVGKQGLEPQMEKMMQILDKNFTSSKRILEVNLSHPLIKNLSKLNIANSNDPILRNCILQLYESALLLEEQLKNPSQFVKRMVDIMIEATKIK